MVKLFENNYKHNPYVYGMVNVLSSFCRDYNEANRALEKYPNDTRCMMIRAYCVDFANFGKSSWKSLKRKPQIL